jgi:PTS system fructose-specific IIC component
MANKGKNLYRHIMTGVSHFIPFVVAGGMLIAFAFLIDAGHVGAANYGSANPISKWLLSTGQTAFSFMLPILSAYIAFSIADRPALVPGMVAGMLAYTKGSGFIGALIGGLIAGYIMYYLKKSTSNLPQVFEATKTLLLFPIVGLILTALVMLGVNSVVQPLNSLIQAWLKNLSTTNSIVLGAVIGGMLAADMGGPINKTAYVFSVASLTSASGSAVATVVMAAAACSGMTISTSCALATTLYPKKFDDTLKQAGKAAYILGLSYIAEGAIPFAIAKPKQVLPSIIAGAAVAGGLAAAFRITMPAPIGGIFTIPLVSNIPMYILSFIIGTLVSTLIMGLLLRENAEEVEETEEV